MASVAPESRADGTVCVNLGAPTVVFTGRLTGHVDGDDLFAWFKQGGCGPVQEINASMGIGWSFHYDRESDSGSARSRTARRPGIATDLRVSPSR